MIIKSQTFYVDPNAVGGSTIVYLTSVDLYFATKPDATNNISGITNPTASISISDTGSTGYPVYAKTYPYSLVNKAYSSITANTTAATATTFTFSHPIQLDTGKVYSIDFSADDPAYTLWYAQTGNVLVGTTNSPFGGFSGGIQGQLYDYGNSGNLTPVTNAQLKYNVKVAKFSANNTTIEVVNDGFEFLITNNQKLNFLGGELVFPLYSNVSAQTVSFTAGSNTVTGTSTVFTSQFTSGQYIIAYSNNTTLYAGHIATVSNNTTLVLDEAASFTNSSCKFFKAPAATVYHNDSSANVLILTDSNASDSTYRFSNSTVFTATLTGPYTNAGTMSTNTTITGLASTTTITGGMLVSANVTGIASGTRVSSIVNSTAVGISAAATATASALFTFSSDQYTSVSSVSDLFVGQPVTANIAGVTSGTTITAIGTTTINVSSVFTGSTTATTNVFAQTLVAGEASGANAYISLINFPVNTFQPQIGVNLPNGSNAIITYDFAASNGSAFVVDTGAFNTAVNYKDNEVTGYSAQILSRSNEVIQSPSYLYSSNNKSAVFKVELSQANNSYSSPFLYSEKLDLFASLYTINNSDTNEEITGQGNAYARHISTVITFDPTYAAQDLLVQTIAFIPAGTRVEAYAKIYNSHDSDTFDVKQWTKLAPVQSGNTAQISTSQSNNYIQLSFGIPNAPLSTTLTGFVSTSNGSASVTGAGTLFNTEISVGDIVKIYNPSNPSIYQISRVNARTNDTSLTLNEKIANTSIGQPGFQIDKVNNPKQAFTNPVNYNVVRYYNTSGQPIDTFDTMQVKVVMLSSNGNVIPRLASLSAVGLSS
jgi:hypothetical protein